MDVALSTIILIITVALIFDFINGFHDAANSIATVVSTRVLSPGKAVLWAAVFNFSAAFFFGTEVAHTVGAGMVDLEVVTYSVILTGLLGAITWNLITWYFGLPTSSSHALFDEQGDPIEVIKWKEIYETMEIVTDRCEDVANVIEGIILKMA